MRPSWILCNLVVLASAGAAESIPSFALSPVTSTVLTDRSPDGTLWALGSDWKIRFGVDGALYCPRFGARAPRNSTLDASLAFATIGGRALPVLVQAEAKLDGSTVEYDHGSIVEIWNLAPNAVEQTFVLPAPVGTGDLVLTLGDRTDLAFVGRDPSGSGLLYENPGIGSVRYGDITVIDAVGRRASVASSVVGGRIELRVPASTLEGLEYPVTIDPLIENLSIDVDNEDDEDPDAASGLAKFLVVYEKVFSATDRDIISRRYEEDGDFLEQIAVDVTFGDTVDPAVAAANSDFMIVWNERADGTIFSDNVIRGRRRIGGSTVQAAAFDISSGAKNEEDPDVGGTDHLITRPFFVVWSEDPLIGGAETHGRAMDGLGNNIGNDVFFGLGNLTTGPRISKNAGSAGRYVVIFESVGTVHRFLDAQLVTEAGAKSGSVVVVAQVPNTDQLHGDVDGDGTTFVALRELKNPGASTDIVAAILQVTGGVLTKLVSDNLTVAELGPFENFDQSDPAIGSEGCRFTFAYRQNEVGGHDEVRTSSFLVADGAPWPPAFLEIGAVHGVLGADERDLSVVSTRFHENGKVLLTWTRDQSSSTTNSQIEGALRSTLLPGGNTIVQTGCGSPEPVLLAGPSAPVGGSISILIGNVASTTPLVAIGFPTSLALCPNQAPCILGVNPIVIQPLPVILSAQIPCSNALLGFTIAVQAIDVVPASTTGPLCGPPKFTQKFRVSDTLHIKFQ